MCQQRLPWDSHDCRVCCYFFVCFPNVCPETISYMGISPHVGVFCRWQLTNLCSGLENRSSKYSLSLHPLLRVCVSWSDAGYRSLKYPDFLCYVSLTLIFFMFLSQNSTWSGILWSIEVILSPGLLLAWFEEARVVCGHPILVCSTDSPDDCFTL